MSYTYDKVYVNDAYPAVTAKQANQYFNERVPGFTKLTKFFCNKNCNAEISCANYTVNFNDERNKGKRASYFVNRKKQKHDIGCTYWENIARKRVGQRITKSLYSQSGNAYVIEFLQRQGLIPNQSKTILTKHSEADVISDRSTQSNPPIFSFPSSEKRKKRHHEFVEIIQLFEEHLEGNAFIRLYDKKHNVMQFSDLFENISCEKGKSTYISNLPKIYYGQAYASKKEGYIVVTFSCPVSLGKSAKFVQFNVFENDCIAKGLTKLYKKLSQRAYEYSNNKYNHESYFTLYYDGTFNIENTEDRTFIILNQTNFESILDHVHVTPN